MGKTRKKTILTLAVSALVFALVCAGAVLLSGDAGNSSVQAGEHPLRISEIMASNSICPDDNGRFCDWIEIENLSDRDFTLSGYRLSDDLTEAKYAFPMGTTIPAGGRLVVWCSSELGSGYANFGISSQGEETIVLMNEANLILDRVDTVLSEKNTSMIRRADGGLVLSDTPTPGYPNDDAGYSQYLSAMGSGGGEIRLSEILPANTFRPGADGLYYDWIEVENVSDHPVSMAGYRLSDREGEARYAFPADLVLESGGFAVVYCAAGTADPLAAPFGLAKNGGETVVLIHPDDTVVDRLRTFPVNDNESCIRTEDGWVATNQPTPGYANDESGYAAYVNALGYGSVNLVISEILTKNEMGITDEDGIPTDWIELYNAGSDAVDLEGWFLSDKAEELNRWRFPAVSIGPGEYLLVYASGKDRLSPLHTSFSLTVGEVVSLSTPVGTVACQVECPALEADESWALAPDGSYAKSAMPTPGKANG